MKSREGFTPKEKEMMLLARETRQGIEVTGMLQVIVHSVYH